MIFMTLRYFPTTRTVLIPHGIRERYISHFILRVRACVLISFHVVVSRSFLLSLSFVCVWVCCVSVFHVFKKPWVCFSPSKTVYRTLHLMWNISSYIFFYVFTIWFACFYISLLIDKYSIYKLEILLKYYNTM